MNNREEDYREDALQMTIDSCIIVINNGGMLMKSKFELIKIGQLVLDIVLTVGTLIVIFTDDSLYQMIGRDPSIRVICIFLWMALGVSFAGILWDLNTHAAFKREYRELDQAVYSDHIAGIANRFSCDAMIEKYMDRPLPEGIGCVVIDVANIREINEQYGHASGNETLRIFSNKLMTASVGLCFVGRNGGNKFLAIFENCIEDQIGLFLSRTNKLVDENNRVEGNPRIIYRAGKAIAKDNPGMGITQLIGLADRRLTQLTDRVTGIANRSGCDELIARYIDKDIIDDIGCMMYDIANIRNINEVYGYATGNDLIREFGEILVKASNGCCFVGRNGGSKFLVMFEACSEERMAQYEKRVEISISEYNENRKEGSIQYRVGKVFHETGIHQINRLVALADRRSKADG